MLDMKNGSTEEGITAPGADIAVAQNRSLTHWIAHVLFMVFNGTCMIVYGYQIYLWLKQGAWKRIPSGLLLRPGTESPFVARAGVMGKAVEWMLNVELAYTLCVIAMLFYGVRWWIVRKGK
jgi:hypothetical protein